MNQIAPKGQVFVCAACGKMSKDQYGYKAINTGWDESCMVNSILCYEYKLVIENNRVIKVEDGGIVEDKVDTILVESKRNKVNKV